MAENRILPLASFFHYGISRAKRTNFKTFITRRGWRDIAGFSRVSQLAISNENFNRSRQISRQKPLKNKIRPLGRPGELSRDYFPFPPSLSLKLHFNFSLFKIAPKLAKHRGNGNADQHPKNSAQAESYQQGQNHHHWTQADNLAHHLRNNHMILKLLNNNEQKQNHRSQKQILNPRQQHGDCSGNQHPDNRHQFGNAGNDGQNQGVFYAQEQKPNINRHADNKAEQKLALCPPADFSF